jgi:hypothetical protein
MKLSSLRHHWVLLFLATAACAWIDEDQFGNRQDQDQDGFYSDQFGGTDCDDGNASVYPGADEIWYDGRDQNCDAHSDYDRDGDGFDHRSYNGTDCDDNDPELSDHLKWYLDADGDGYGDPAGLTKSCDQPRYHVTDSSDCDDSSSANFPGAAERCDAVDNNCDGIIDEDSAIDATLWYVDADADGYGSTAESNHACLAQDGYVGNSQDCDDFNEEIHPRALEICNDHLDNDCDETPNNCEFAAVLYLQNTAQAIFMGKNANNRFGATVSFIGDFDQDGFDDIAFGAEQYGSLANNSGSIRIFWGPGITRDSPDGINQDTRLEYTITGTELGTSGNAYDRLGYRIATAGDINDDGFPDLAISAPGYESDSGLVYIYTGNSLRTAYPPIILSSSAKGTEVGSGIASAGDVTGDGVDDFYVGAKKAAFSFSSAFGEDAVSAGATYLVPGPLTDNKNLLLVETQFRGDGDGADAGRNLDSSGDLDGDGLNDLIISAVSSNAGGEGSGVVYVFYPPFTAGQHILSDSAEYAFVGAGKETGTGEALSNGTDLNDDGYADIVIGSPKYNSNRGATYIQFGGKTYSEINSLYAADWTFIGSLEDTNAGKSVVAGFDSNGDSFHDLLIGGDLPAGGSEATLFQGPLYETGATYNRNDAAAIFYSPSYDRTMPMHASGDFNGDGFSDLLFGQPDFSSSGTMLQQGRAFIQLGRGQ